MLDFMCEFELPWGVHLLDKHYSGFAHEDVFDSDLFEFLDSVKEVDFFILDFCLGGKIRKPFFIKNND